MEQASSFPQERAEQRRKALLGHRENARLVCGLAALGSRNEMQESGRAPAGRHRAVIKASTSPRRRLWLHLDKPCPLPRLCLEGRTGQQSSPLPPPVGTHTHPRARLARSEEGPRGRFQGPLLLSCLQCRACVLPAVDITSAGWLSASACSGLALGTGLSSVGARWGLEGLQKLGASLHRSGAGCPGLPLIS